MGAFDLFGPVGIVFFVLGQFDVLMSCYNSGIPNHITDDCTCKWPYFGNQCQFIQCHNHGYQVGWGNNASCECLPGLTGLTCQTILQCWNNGIIYNRSTTTSVCKCTSICKGEFKYFGPACQFAPCRNAQLIIFDNTSLTSSCECQNNYRLRDPCECMTAVNPLRAELSVGIFGNIHETWHLNSGASNRELCRRKCYEKEIVNSDCDCFSQTIHYSMLSVAKPFDVFYGGRYSNVCSCECYDGFAEKGCRDVSRCRNNGIMRFLEAEQRKVCVCERGFGGALCEIPPCYANFVKYLSDKTYGFSTTLMKSTIGENEFYCACTEPDVLAGPLCATPVQCFNGGKLHKTSANEEQNCMCLPGFSGIACEIVLPSLVVLENNTVCINFAMFVVHEPTGYLCSIDLNMVDYITNGFEVSNENDTFFVQRTGGNITNVNSNCTLKDIAWFGRVEPKNATSANQLILFVFEEEPHVNFVDVHMFLLEFKEETKNFVQILSKMSFSSILCREYVYAVSLEGLRPASPYAIYAGVLSKKQPKFWHLGSFSTAPKKPGLLTNAPVATLREPNGVQISWLFNGSNCTGETWFIIEALHVKAKQNDAFVVIPSNGTWKDVPEPAYDQLYVVKNRREYLTNVTACISPRTPATLSASIDDLDYAASYTFRVTPQTAAGRASQPSPPSALVQTTQGEDNLIVKFGASLGTVGAIGFLVFAYLIYKWRQYKRAAHGARAGDILLWLWRGHNQETTAYPSVTSETSQEQLDEE